MMQRFLLALGLVFCAATASAQGTIRSGEHGEFTRIVIPIGSDRDFSVEGEGNNRRVILDPPGAFRTNRVFDTLFADSRLQGLESNEENGVVLELSCACDILSYRFQSSYLVLDIYDPSGSPEPDTPPETEEVAQTEPEIPLPIDAPTVERSLASQRPYRPAAALATDLLQTSLPPLPRLAAVDESAVAMAGDQEMDDAPMADMSDNGMDMQGSGGLQDMPISRERTPEPMQEMMAEATDDMDMADDADMQSSMTGPDRTGAQTGLEDTADALAQQLARAAAAGLLETSAFEPLTAADPPAATADDDAPEESDVADGDPEPTGLPVRAANAFDVAGNRDGGLSAIAAALSCAQPIGNMASWSDGLGFEQQLGALRQAAFDSQGDLLRGPTIDLARYYIYHGFGAEAEAWLLQLEEPPQTELSMARYLDDRPGPNFPEVETLALCSGLDILWRFVDAPDFPELALSQRQEMRLAFSALPLGLRRLLGPDFVRRLAAEGYDDDAADVREALARGPTLDDAEALVLEMETTDERPTRSDTQALENQLQDAGPDVARVMREYLAARRQASDPPEADHLNAAEALLRETAADRSIGSLWHEVLLAHTAEGNVDRVFPMLDTLLEGPTEDRQEIAQTVVDILLANQQDAALIVMSTRLAAQPDGPELPFSQRNAIYERLTSFGLDDLAEPFSPTATMMDDLPATPSQNWAAAAAGTEGPAAQVARRIADLETSGGGPMEPENPDDMRAALEDSRAMRAELAALLGGSSDN